MIKTEIYDHQVRQALDRLAESAADPSPALRQIGELLVDSTKQRFATSTAPDGSRWAENSDITLLQYLGKYKGSFRKNKKDGKGSLTQKGAARLGSKKPLIGESGSLARQISYRLQGDTLLVGSTMEYAAAHQFGMVKGYAGANKRGSPIPWGDIPARPFLGLSNQDRGMILDEIAGHLGRSLRP